MKRKSVADELIEELETTVRLLDIPDQPNPCGRIMRDAAVEMRALQSDVYHWRSLFILFFIICVVSHLLR